MRWIRWIDTLVAVFVVTLVVIARMPSSSSANTIAPVVNANATCGKAACGSGFNMSFHDFLNGPGASFAGKVNLNGTMTQVGQCTLCHTPHRGLQTQLLWNHHLSNNSQFTWDVNSTMAGTPFATIANTWNGSTTKCLSCHDGSVSEDTINWFQAQTPIPVAVANVTCTTTAGVTSCVSTTVRSDTVGNGGNMTGTHPVAMPYPCGQVPNSYDGVTTGGGLTSTEWVAAPPAPIEIYTAPGATVSRQPQGACTGTTNGIECGSCHDVHNGSGAVYDLFLLRGNIVGPGYICQLCHTK